MPDRPERETALALTRLETIRACTKSFGSFEHALNRKEGGK